MSVKRDILNSPTQLKKLVHLNGRKEFNLRPTNRNRNTPSSFVRAAGA
jgi:hypothetical protein